MATAKQRRATCRAQLTRFETFLDEEAVNRRRLQQIPTRLVRLKEIFQEFEDTFLEDLAQEISGEDNTEIAEIRANADRELLEFENKYYLLVSNAKSLIAPVENANDVLRQSARANTPDLATQFQAKVKLPQLSIPKYAGEYDQWQSFHDTYVSLIHNEATLTNVQKFHYLQRALVGNAAKIIERIQPTDVNYTVAWELLKTRCGNKKSIVKTHIKNILELQSSAKQSHNVLGGFVDALENNVKALSNLGLPVEQWDAILLYILVDKLDAVTKEKWETLMHKEESPTVGAFIEFLRERCTIMESLVNTTSSKAEPNKTSDRERRSHSHLVTNSVKCTFCQGDHLVYVCEKFKELPVAKRRLEVTRLNLCFNCLRRGHLVQNCKSGTCRVCSKKHNSLLHQAEISAQQEVGKNLTNQSVSGTNTKLDAVESSNSTVANASISCNSYGSSKLVLLSTAIVDIFDNKGNPIACRALLDSGSQSSFMTMNLFNRLKLEFSKVNIPVIGINAVTANTITKLTQSKISSKHSSYEASIPFLVTNKITDKIPQNNICREVLQLPRHLKLADPNFDKVGDIDILLGVNIFYGLLLNKQIRLGNEIILQESRLGWIVSGTVPEIINNFHTNCNFAQTNEHDIQNQLEAFWRVEEINDKHPKWSAEEAACEQHFVNNFNRDLNGRFVVKLPLRNNFDTLGESRDIAIQRFQSLEYKFKKDHGLKDAYTKFMDEYLELDHMSLIDSAKESTLSYCYLPHHSVRKEDSLTTKLRVVFDASAKTKSGVSLNDVLMVGPSIQDDIFTILFKFRMHNIVYTADIEKMYRQVRVCDEHVKLQCIVWRNDPAAPLQHYALNTITYGTAPASFLATRCLKQLGLENAQTYPRASQTIISDFYMDDLISGATDRESARLTIQQIDNILRSAGFILRQWASNDKEILNDINMGTLNSQYIVKDNSCKTLGVYWQADSDTLRYKIKGEISNNVTKRIMLSIISQIFDPLGLVGPVIVKAKILLQKLWQYKLGWDDNVPKHLLFEWYQFYDKLPILENLRIDRHVLVNHPTSVNIHCFCDASQVAYGACVYMVSSDSGQVLTRLITAKSRVAPLKVISLPRLELCAASLASELVHQIKGALQVNINNYYYWSDSTVVLSWLSSEPNRFKTFVANRISRIQGLTKDGKWRYVPTAQNPADIISRGVNPEQISDNHLWWNGPEFLLSDSSCWPVKQAITIETLPESKNKLVTCNKAMVNYDVISRYSSFSRLLRVVAYMYRFVNNAKRSSTRFTGDLSIEEIEHSETVLCKVVQNQYFYSELTSLRSGRSVHKNSKLASLDPFLDDNGLLRVGGRLRNSQLSYQHKHPIILPNGGHFVSLIVRREHYLNLHAGTQAVLSAIRTRFWPLSGKRTVKAVLKKCIVCFKARPTELSQKMADLPINRVTMSRPFLNCGVDYAGPYQIKNSKFKNKKYIKAYICIFTCFSTRAMHIELVSDLTTDGFLNAFKRFVARRGLCSNVYSDNATNFVGADKRLREVATWCDNNTVQNYLLANKVRWQFIPPRSPHFGGLWESVVKQTKHHLTRVLNNVILTYEELYTLLTQIESIINSRPLIPLTDEPDSMEVLTPGHFLIGVKLNAVPEPIVNEERATLVNRYKHLQLLTQQFWKKWSHDYLHTLQQRTKWRFAQEGVFKNALVLIKEDNQPTMSWRMGRVVDIHPGVDGNVRVVSIRTSTGVITRAVTKICLLPISQEEVTHEL